MYLIAQITILLIEVCSYFCVLFKPRRLPYDLITECATSKHLFIIIGHNACDFYFL